MPKWLLTLNKKDEDTDATPDDNQPDHEQTSDTDPDCSDSEEDSSINDPDSEQEVPQQHSKYNLRQQTVCPQRLMYINVRVELPQEGG